MAFTRLVVFDEIAVAGVGHGLLTYIGTNEGKVYSVVNTTGAMTLIGTVNARIVAMSITYPTLFVATDQGEIYTYTISASADPDSIVIGTCNPGILFNGTVTKGISFAGATPAFSSADDAFIAIGTWNTPLVISGQTQHFVPIQVNLESASSISRDIAAARFRVNTSATVANTLTAVNVLELRSKLQVNIGQAANLQASTEVSANISCAYDLLVGYFSLQGSGQVTCSNHVNVLEATCVQTSPASGCKNVAHFTMNSTGVTIGDIIKAENIIGTATNLIEVVNTGGTVTNGLSISGTIAAAIELSGVTPGTNAGDMYASLMLGGKATTGGHTAPSNPIAFATANQHGLMFYLASSASQFTGIEMNVYTSAASAGTQWQNPLVAGEFTVRSLKANGAVDNMWAVLAQAQILSTNYGPGTGKQMIAGYFKTGVAATANGSAGNGGLSTCIYLDTGLNHASVQGDFMIMQVCNNAAGVPLSAFQHFYGGAQYVLSFDAIMNESDGHAWDAVDDKTGLSKLGWIKVRVAYQGAYKDKYIQLYGANT